MSPEAVLTILATLLSPVIAIQVSEYLRRKQDKNGRKLGIFRVLVSTRATKVTPEHVQALNLIDLDFRDHTNVTNAWKLYLSHLNDSTYPVELWERKTNELFADMVQEMSKVVNYSLDKDHIMKAWYSPVLHSRIENEQQALRTLMIKALENGALKLELAPQPNKSNSVSDTTDKPS